MRKTFSPYVLSWFGTQLKERVDEVDYLGDMSDLGNELGVIIGKHYKDFNDEDIEMFIQGFKHGISLTNGTHP